MLFLLTPNLEEASVLTGDEVRDLAGMRQAARKLAALGPRAVLVKGGHSGNDDATDILFHRGAWTEFTSPRIETRHTHGTGCTFSAAITAVARFRVRSSGGRSASKTLHHRGDSQ